MSLLARNMQLREVNVKSKLKEEEEDEEENEGGLEK